MDRHLTSQFSYLGALHRVLQGHLRRQISPLLALHLMHRLCPGSHRALQADLARSSLPETGLIPTLLMMHLKIKVFNAVIRLSKQTVSRGKLLGTCKALWAVRFHTSSSRNQLWLQLRKLSRASSWSEAEASARALLNKRPQSPHNSNSPNPQIPKMFPCRISKPERERHRGDRLSIGQLESTSSRD